MDSRLEQLKSSEPRHRKVGNGREDGSIREGLAATSGEKPLKVGCPWTIQHETGLADRRHARSRGRQPRPVGVEPQGDTRRPRERGLAGVGGTQRRSASVVTRKRTKQRPSSDDGEGFRSDSFSRPAPLQEPDEGVLRESRGGPQGIPEQSGVRSVADRFRTRAIKA